MTKQDRFLAVVFFFTLLLCLFGLWFGAYEAHAQDNPITFCQSPSDAGIVFTFSNIPDAWLGDMGWYAIGDAVRLEDHMLIVTGLQFDNGYAYAIIGDGGHGENVTASSDNARSCGVQDSQAIVISPTAENTANDRIRINAPIQQTTLSSTGRTCVIAYPKIILVCDTP